MKTRNYGPLQKHICKVLVKYKDVFNDELPLKYMPRRNKHQKIKVKPKLEPPSKAK